MRMLHMSYLPSLVSSCVVLVWSSAVLSAPIAQWELGVVLTRNPDPENGAMLYATCAACHGTKGEGASDGSVPAIAGQSFTVLAKQIVDFRAGVRNDPRMEHSVDRRHLSFSQPVADVAFYISRLAPPNANATPVGVNVEQGAMAYARTCARCHGEFGEGKEDTLAPRLAGQHYTYILAQLDAAVNGSRQTMVTSHSGLQKSMSRSQLESIAGYLTSLGP
jgi:cytochrome c553